MTTSLLLFIAEAGLVCCTAFLLLVMAGAACFRREQSKALEAEAARLKAADDGKLKADKSGKQKADGTEKLETNRAMLPAVTLLKPLHGLEPEMEAKLESFFRQDYPEFEIVFGARDADDSALAVVRRLQMRYPHVRVKIEYSGRPAKPNAKVYLLSKMMGAAANDYLVISDSDVRVGPDYLREVVRPLLDPAVGLVTCVYRGISTGTIWSRLEALGMSVEMTSGVLVADLLEGMKFALGPTMAVRREVLEAVAQWSDLADYCADDYVLGDSVYRSGMKVVLSHYVIDHFANNRGWKDSILHQVRWAKSTRFSRPWGHPATVLTFAMPFGLLGMAVAFFAGRPQLAIALIAWALLNRIILAVVTGWGCLGDRSSLIYSWLYPVRDFMGFLFWASSFLGREIVWRAERYRLEYGGKMARSEASSDKNIECEKILVLNRES